MRKQAEPTAIVSFKIKVKIIKKKVMHLTQERNTQLGKLMLCAYHQDHS